MIKWIINTFSSLTPLAKVFVIIGGVFLFIALCYVFVFPLLFWILYGHESLLRYIQTIGNLAIWSFVSSIGSFVVGFFDHWGDKIINFKTEKLKYYKPKEEKQ